MTDGVISGSKNSRLLKSPDSIPATYEDFRALLLGAGLPVDLIINEAGWVALGTALSKANLLKDATATKLGLNPGDNPTVDDAFAKLVPFQIGDIVNTVRNDKGSDYLLCNGALYDTITYPDLGAADPKAGQYTSKQIYNYGGTSVAAYESPVYFAGKYVVCTWNSAGGIVVWYADDPLGTWSQATVIASADRVPIRMKVVNGNLVIIAYSSMSPQSIYVHSSTNITAWAESNYIDLGSSQYGADIIWDGTRYALATKNMHYLKLFSKTTLGTGSWTAHSQHAESLNPYYLRSFIYAGGNYVVLLSSGNSVASVVYYNTVWNNGSFAYVANVGTGYATGLAYLDSKFAFILETASNTKIVHSTTPQGTKTEITLPTQGACNAAELIYDGSYYYVLSAAYLWRSASLTTGWTYVGPLSLNTRIRRVNGKYICPTGSGSIVSIWYSATAPGSYKKLPTISPTDAYAYIRAR